MGRNSFGSDTEDRLEGERTEMLETISEERANGAWTDVGREEVLEKKVQTCEGLGR